MTRPVSLRILLLRGIACAALVSASALLRAQQTSAGQPPPPPDAASLNQRIAALLAAPEVSSAHWGIAVTTLDGTPIYSLNEAQLFRPASNAKLFTTSAAMALLGPEKTFETRIYGKLDAATGMIAGDLMLQGGGDASFGTNDLPYRAPAPNQAEDQSTMRLPELSDLSAMVDQLAAAGLKRVKGDVLGDDSAFDWGPNPEGWSTEDLPWAYGAPASALNLGDNEMRLTVAPGNPPNAIVTLDQNGTNYYKLDSPVETTAAHSQSSIDVESFPGSRNITVVGKIAAGTSPDVEYIAVSEPASYAAEVLQSMLIAHGIEIDGHTVPLHTTSTDARSFLTRLYAPGGTEHAVLKNEPIIEDCLRPAPPGPVLAVHVSPPLIEDITYTLKVSQNLHAETLLLNLGRLNACSGSITTGARMVRAWLTNAGIAPSGFIFYDGSGLSTKDLVTPRATTQLLAYDAKQPWFAQWKAALPIGGVDGTLEHRFTGAPLKGHVFAKTGTLGESAALSGYVDAASGRTVVFSIFADTHLPSDPAIRDTIDRIVAAIAAAE